MCHTLWTKKEGGHTHCYFLNLYYYRHKTDILFMDFGVEICVKIYRNNKKNVQNSRITFIKNKYFRKTDFVLNILLDFKDIFHSQIWNVFKNCSLRMNNIK